MSPTSAGPGGASSPRQVLIVGATGFLGSALTRRLVEQGDHVIALGRSNGSSARSHYHATLAGIRMALGGHLSYAEVQAPAALFANPENKWDSNAVGVFIHGANVGHLDRYDAEEYQPPFAGRRSDLVGASILGGRATDKHEVGAIGVRLESVPAPEQIRQP